MVRSSPSHLPNFRYPRILCQNSLRTVWTPYLYTGAPKFTIAFAVNLASSVLAIVFACFTRMYLVRKNAELDRGDRSARGAPTEEQVAAGFRYLI